jgi:hypothetical protein
VAGHTSSVASPLLIFWSPVKGEVEVTKMNSQLSQRVLEQENECFFGTGGVSAGNRHRGFRPAFFDTHTRVTYESRFANGSPAPFHLLDGLPDEIVLARSATGRVTRVKSSVVAGFVSAGEFYTREAAAKQVAEMTG